MFCSRCGRSEISPMENKKYWCSWCNDWTQPQKEQPPIDTPPLEEPFLEESTWDSFMECPYCKVSIKTKNLTRHTKKCSLAPQEEIINQEPSQALLPFSPSLVDNDEEGLSSSSYLKRETLRIKELMLADFEQNQGKSFRTKHQVLNFLTNNVFPAEKKVRLHSYPSLIFFWPLLILSLLIGVLIDFGIFLDKPEFIDWNGVIHSIKPGAPEELQTRILTSLWIIGFALNLGLLSLKFGLLKILFLLGGLISALLVLLANLISFPLANEILLFVNIQANNTFFYLFFLVLLLLLLRSLLQTRWDYWMITPHEIVHFTHWENPTTYAQYTKQGARITVETSDPLLYCLGFSGTLKLKVDYFQTLTIPNIFRVKEKEKEIRHLFKLDPAS